MSSKRSRAAFEAHDRNEGNPPPHAPYTFYGTPLPAYDAKERDDGSYLPVWKQEVTDEHGRKRLHGAFTGGWSAGYFNTVGSKEGWAPSAFVSSRSNRAKDRPSAQRVEDFMDEEDLAERAESQRLETQDAFAGIGSSGGERGASRAMFDDLFRSTSEKMGVKLLQRMGWRPGQGIGAKVRRRAKGDEKGTTHSFAPENSHMIIFQRKTDRKGVGYVSEASITKDGVHEEDDDGEGSDRDARILQVNRSKILNKPSKLKKKGIGVGVLNDNGSDDDEDPYALGPQIKYNRIIGVDRKKKKGLSVTANVKSFTSPGNSVSKISDRSKLLTGFRKCHDGRLPLDGFVLTTAGLNNSSENRYPLPEVPEGWKPAKSLQQQSESTTPLPSTAEAARSSTLGPKARATLLGEQQLPGKSVFDFISPTARDRLAAASGKSNLPPALGEGAPAGFEGSDSDKRRTLWDLVPALDKTTAEAALHRGSTGWMPYAEDTEKRARYRYFLVLRAGKASSLPERPSTFSLDEWSAELREFAQAAAVFKPVSGLMASRFTSSVSAPSLASDAPDPMSSSRNKEEDPAEKAAKLGMYGPITRSRKQFYPVRLLCKRFGVRPPAGGTAGPPEDSESFSDADQSTARSTNNKLELVPRKELDRMMMETNFRSSGNFVSGGTEGGNEMDHPKSQTEPPAVVDLEVNAALESQKAGDAVFKAIFGSDDEDED